MPVCTQGPQEPTRARSRRANTRRRCTAGAVAAALSSTLVLASSATPAGATPLASATFTGSATSSTLSGDATAGALSDTFKLTPTSATVGRNTSSATAANAIIGSPSVAVQQIAVSAPPPATDNATLISVSGTPVLNATIVSDAVTASWPAVGTCPAATTPASLSTVTTALASVAALGNDFPWLIQTGAATTTSSTKLVSAAGPSDTRAVQVKATNTISSLDLFGGADLPVGFTIDIAGPTALTATATGVVGTSSVAFTPGAVTVEGPGAGPNVSVAPGATFTLPATVLGIYTITGTIKVNNLAASTNTGTAVSADASLLTLNLTATDRETSTVFASASLDVAKLHVGATAPASGIQCAPIIAPTSAPPTSSGPPTPPIPSGPPQTGAGGTAGLQNTALIAVGLALLIGGAGAGSLAVRRRRTDHAL